ncbi:MAG: band 7 protein [Hyphomicrobiales bacterium]|nr:band 7 protein [Hyphomicrobiales bacterium]
MVQIRKFPFIRQIRADASSYIQYFRKGKLERNGRGLAFWFLPNGASITEIPIDDRQLSFMLKGQSIDFQELALQGTVIWRVTDPLKLAARIDFAVNLDTGLHNEKPVEQINGVLVSLVRQFAYAHLKEQGVRQLLETGVAPLQTIILENFTADQTLDGLGLELVGVSISSLAPSSELTRALQAPTFESLQQQADEASFARRAMAVEKERAIAENELGNKIELAARQKELIALEDDNARSEAEAQAAAMNIHTEAKAASIRLIDQAKADMEHAHLEAYKNLSPTVLLAMAAKEFATKIENIDNLTITPDMLAGLMKQVRGIFNDVPQVSGTEQ